MVSKPEVIHSFVEAYRKFARIPVPISGEILNTNDDKSLVQICSKWKQRNIERGENIKLQKYHIVQLSTNDVLFESKPTDITQEVLSSTSKTGKYKCVVKKVKQESKTKTYIEIWDENGLYKNFDIFEFEVHGDIYEDGEFSSLNWSPVENKLIYVAEEKKKKVEPFYKQKSTAENTKIFKYEEEISLGNEYLYKPDWGEQLNNKHQPIICICDVDRETLKVLPGIPSTFSPGQIIWSTDGSGIFGVVYENEPRRMGLVYCTNRTSYIFFLNFKEEFSLLSDKNKSVRSPRLSLDGNYLFWLQRSNTGVHHGCQELVKFDLKSKQTEVLIDIVKQGDMNFSGLYMHDLPLRCFSKDGTKLFFSTLHKFKIVSYYIDLVTKNIHELKTNESSTILDVQDDMILISSGDFQKSPALKLLKFMASEAKWFNVTQSQNFCETLIVREIELESDYCNQGFSYFNALYYGPSNINQTKSDTFTKATPLLVYAHGGPHSAIFNDFSLEFNFFVSLGYGILAVNYRGSTGVGQSGVEFLRGKLGNTDVKDIHDAVLKTLQSFPCLDEKNIFLYGKSYGGFLVSQLSAQYPDFYRAVVNCNGVSDLISMYSSSDIPDWSTSECGFNFNEAKPLSLSEITKMLEVSPLQMADKIKAPTLFAVGKKDCRVPFFQGISLYNALKARQIEVRLNLYDSDHSLGNVPVHIDYVINTALWYWKHKV